MAAPSESPVALRAISYLLRGGLALIVLAAGVGIAAALFASREPPGQARRHDRVITVRAMEARPIAIPRVWSGYGTARAMRTADVSAQVSARVVERPARIEAGATVQAGEVLVRLETVDFEQRSAASEALIASWEAQLAGLDVDDRRLGAQVEIMREEVRLQERELARIMSAVELRGANEMEVERRQQEVSRRRRELTALEQQFDAIAPKREQVRAQITAERANLRLARENLERATVRAPIAGVLQRVNAQPGELLTVGAPIARIVDLSRIEVPLRLPASSADSVAAGDGAELWRDAPGAGGDPPRWRGTVARIAPEADAQSRTVTVFVEVNQRPDGSRLLLPGQFVVASITAAADRPRIAVPRIAVSADRVMVADAVDGGARARAIPVRVLFYARGPVPELDPVEAEWAVLESGLVGGERVITTNLDEVRDGTPVRLGGEDAVVKDGGVPARGGGS